MDKYIGEVVFTISLGILFGQHLLSMNCSIHEHELLLYVLVHRESNDDTHTHKTK